jgi:hypothetical protein
VIAGAGEKEKNNTCNTASLVLLLPSLFGCFFTFICSRISATDSCVCALLTSCIRKTRRGELESSGKAVSQRRRRERMESRGGVRQLRGRIKKSRAPPGPACSSSPAFLRSLLAAGPDRPPLLLPPAEPGEGSSAVRSRLQRSAR